MPPITAYRACVALLTLIVITVFAPGARADDAELIATCLKTESDAGRDFHTCIGRVSGPCDDEPAAQTTFGMVECTRREAKIWDDILNDEYGRLLGVLQEKAAESVRKAQRLWIEMRDADCRVPYDIFEGGTVANLIAARCMLDRTADRSMQIRDWRETAEEH